MTTTTSQPTVILVHGAFADAASWAAVTQRLLAARIPVRAIVNPLRGIAPVSAYAASVINQTPGPVLAVGHSYGGAVITNAAPMTTNVVGLVYVAAYSERIRLSDRTASAEKHTQAQAIASPGIALPATGTIPGLTWLELCAVCTGGGERRRSRGVGNCGQTEGLSKPCVNRAPFPRPIVDLSVRSALVVQYFGEHDRRIAFRTVSTQPYRPTEQLTRWTTTLADETFTATRAFVDGVCHEESSVLKILAECWELGTCLAPTTQPVRQLLAGPGSKTEHACPPVVTHTPCTLACCQQLSRRNANRNAR